MSVADLGFARLDTDRRRRTGDPEVVYGRGKTPAQVVAALAELHRHHPDRAVLATRLDDAALAAVGSDLPGAPGSARCPSRPAGSRSSRPAPRTAPSPPRPP